MKKKIFISHTVEFNDHQLFFFLGAQLIKKKQMSLPKAQLIWIKFTALFLLTFPKSNQSLCLFLLTILFKWSFENKYTNRNRYKYRVFFSLCEAWISSYRNHFHAVRNIWSILTLMSIQSNVYRTRSLAPPTTSISLVFQPKTLVLSFHSVLLDYSSKLWMFYFVLLRMSFCFDTLSASVSKLHAILFAFPLSLALSVYLAIFVSIVVVFVVALVIFLFWQTHSFHLFHELHRLKWAKPTVESNEMWTHLHCRVLVRARTFIRN